MRVLVTLTKSEWPYTKVQRIGIELEPDQIVKTGDGWIIAEVRHVSDDQDPSPLTEVAVFKKPDDVKPEEPKPDPEGVWLTWPPHRTLVVGHEYLIRTLHGQQKHQREWRMSYLGPGMGPGEYQFNARPFAGTQELGMSSIVATKDLGKSQGRDDARRYCNRTVVVKPG